MADHLSKTARSALMSKIGSKNSAPELALRRGLHALGLRFRLHVGRLPGKPDLVLSKHRTCIFVHGCFWHRHSPCVRATVPKTNIAFWEKKFERNVTRDLAVTHELKKLGWRVYVVWECELSSQERANRTCEKINASIQNKSRP